MNRGLTEEAADTWCERWEAEADWQTTERGPDSWDRALDWVTDQMREETDGLDKSQFREITRPDDEVRAYWEESWSSAIGARDEERRYELEPFIHSVAQFTRHRGEELLEIGVGSGIDHVQWARAGLRCHGVDLTDEAIAQTAARLGAEGLESDLHRGNAEVLPYADNTFHVVYSWGVIHHADHPDKVLSEVWRVLKPGGVFIGMLYERRSAVAFKLWLRHALLALRPRRSLADVLASHMESPGTKAYTFSEVRALLAAFKAVRLEHFVTPYDRARLPRIVAGAIPRRLGWFIAIRATK